MGDDDNNKAAPFAATANRLATNDVLVWSLKDGYITLTSQNISKDGDVTTSALFTAPRSRKIQEAQEHEDEGIDLDAKVEGMTLADTPTVPDPFASCLSIAATVTDHQTYAFAIRDTDKTVCMVSPVCMPLFKNVADGLGIAATTTEKNIWVFYIAKVSGNNRIFKVDPANPKKAYKINEYDPIDQSQMCAAVMTPAEGGTPLPYVFYQKSKGIYQSCAETTYDDSSQIRKIQSLPPTTTPLAVTPFGDRMFLFFLNSNYALHATMRTNGQWGNTFPLLDEGGMPIVADTQSGLSASADPTNTRIIIVYKQKAGDTITQQKPCDVYIFDDPIAHGQ